MTSLFTKFMKSNIVQDVNDFIVHEVHKVHEVHEEQYCTRCEWLYCSRSSRRAILYKVWMTSLFTRFMKSNIVQDVNDFIVHEVHEEQYCTRCEWLHCSRSSRRAILYKVWMTSLFTKFTKSNIVQGVNDFRSSCLCCIVLFSAILSLNRLVV